MSTDASLEQLENIYNNREQQGLIDAINNAQAVIEFEVDGTIISANANFLKTVGYSLEEIKGKHHMIFCDDAYVASDAYKQFWASLAAGNAQPGEFKRKKKSGEEIWISASYNPVVDADGKPYKVVKFATDITEQKRLARINLSKTTGFENSSAAMMMVDRDFVVTEVNNATKELLARSADVFAEIWPNFDPENIIGTCIDMFHKNPAHQRKLLSDPANLPWRTDITIGDFKFALNVGGIFDEKGEYVGNLLEWDDVTESRLNAGVLSALDKAQATIEFTVDGRILNANQNFLKIMGYELQELVGANHSMFVDASDSASPEYKAFWDKLAAGETQDGQYRRVSKSGEIVWVQATYNPILDGNGSVFKIVLFATDITEQKEIERANLNKTTGFANSSAAMMMVDRDFVVTEVNNATKELLARSADVFAEIWPNFDPENIIGTCIDMFHKNPAHQRKLLSDPANLPWRTDITIGDFKFALNVGGIFDEKGEYVGNLLEWDDVTESRLNAGVLSALDKAQAVIEFSTSGQIMNANENFLKTMGYDLEEIQGQHHRIFCDEAYAASDAYKQFWASLAAGEFKSAEVERKTKDGTSVWISATYNPIVDGNGQVFKIVKFASEISQQMELRKTAETLSLVANETDNSVIITDAQGRMEYVNPGFEKLTGFSLAEALGKKPGDLLQGKHTDPDAVQRIRAKLDAQSPFYEEILNYDKTGEPYWIALAINPVFNKQTGELEKFVSIQTNINETKLEQQSFNCKLDAISRTMAVIEFTPDGTILDANENFCAAAGYALEEIKGKHHRIFCDPTYSASSEYAAFWANLRSGEFDAGKYKRFNKAGDELWLQASYSPIFDQENNVVRVVKFASDITKEVEIEQEVSRIANDFASQSANISVEAGSVAEGAQSLGATTEEISASIEELSASIDSIAQNSDGADQIAQHTKSEADAGAQAIAKVDRIHGTDQ